MLGRQYCVPFLVISALYPRYKLPTPNQIQVKTQYNCLPLSDSLVSVLCVCWGHHHELLHSHSQVQRWLRTQARLPPTGTSRPIIIIVCSVVRPVECHCKNCPPTKVVEAVSLLTVDHRAPPPPWVTVRGWRWRGGCPAPGTCSSPPAWVRMSL